MKIATIVLCGLLAVAGLSACGDEATVSDPHKPLPLAMDMPDTDPGLKKSKQDVRAKAAPDVVKSKIDFILSEKEIADKLAGEAVVDKVSCLERIAPQESLKHSVQRDGGMWGYLEQTGELKKYSSIGMLLDTKFNKMMFALRHICETAKGLPFENLGYLMSRDLKNLGEEKVREKLMMMGIPLADIDDFVEYGKFAAEANKRSIDYSSIHKTILQTEVFATKYREFADRLSRKENLEATLADVQALHDAVEKFIAKNDHMITALHDDNTLPYEDLYSEM